jgi:transposase
MMGQHARSESLFYYFRLEDQVSENHLLRLVDRHIDFGFLRERLKDSYSETGRPSIDPELLLRILLIGYLYGISSERKLVEELRMHLAWRWFTALGFDQEVPHHSTFSKNRHGRFQESNVFEQLFEEVVDQCLAVGLVRGDKLSVDGTFVEANASKESRISREQLAEVAQVNRTVREYLAELEIQNPVEEPTHSQDKVSTTDPDSTYATKGGTPARMGYYNNYLIDNDSCIVVGVQATGARLSEESRSARDIYLLAGEQQLHLPWRPATELRRTQRAEPHVRLYRDAQEVRPVPTEIPVHDWTVPVSCYPHERDRSAAGARSLDYTGVQARTTATKEGRGALRGAKKSQSHRSQSAPAAQVEVRTRTVLPSGHCPEHQAAGPVPQPASDVASTRHFIGSRSRLTQQRRSIPKTTKTALTFSTPTGQFTH